jgi:hypothetical protein
MHDSIAKSSEQAGNKDSSEQAGNKDIATNESFLVQKLDSHVTV